MTDEQTAQFVAITAGSADQAREYITACGGDVNQAVQRFFTNPPDAHNQPPPEPEVRAPDNAQFDTLVGGPPRGPNPQINFGQAGMGMLNMFSGMLSGVGGPAQTVASRRQSGNRNLSASYASTWASDNTETSNSGAALGDLFAPPSYVFQGSTAEACVQAEQQNKQILVNIQTKTEFACHTLNRDVWKDDVISQLVQQHFIFIQYDDQSPEGQKYCQYHKVLGKKFPHIAVMDPGIRAEIRVFSGESGFKATKQKIQEALFQWIETKSGVNKKRPRPEAELPPPRVSPNARNTDEEMLQRAIAASTASMADGAPMNEDEEKRPNSGGSTSVSLPPPPAQPAPIAGSALPPLPDEPPETADPATVTSIRVSLPGGKTRNRKFFLSSQARQIYNWCANELSKLNFSLKTRFPPKTLTDEDLGKTLQELGFKNVALVVNMN